VSHEWDAEFIDGPHFRGTVLSGEYPWLAARLREATPLLISKLDDFPPEAANERATCERIGIQSIVWAPFVAAHGLQGYVALSTVNRPGSWLEGVVPRLGLVGNVFASAIERRRADLNLQEAYKQIQALKDHLEAENITLREEVKTSFKDDFIGKSHAIKTVLHQVEQVGGTDAAVLLMGDTGTGKGVVARRIHERSRRRDRPLVTVNCAALPAALIESELFGHEKGAFTGAVNRKIGRFELADGATIFLDEIGDLPIELQAKLLRVLHDQEFERLGSSTVKTVDTRVIAATNRDLDRLIEEGAFRADLYYRLSVFPIRIPSLCEHRDDIPLLVWFFITNLQTRLGKTFETVAPGVMDALISYHWPGNVRELRNIVERAMILSPGPSLELRGILPVHETRMGASARASEHPGAGLKEIERAHIVTVLEECDWRVRGKDGAAERLRLKRSTLQSRMKKLGIQRPTA
jgi:transcriptional regulator with GAF, ATPase, and Fis domain